MGKTKRHRQSRSKRRKQQLDTTKAEDGSLSETDLERAISFHQAGELDQAIQAYQAAVEINPRDVIAYNNLGNILREQERPEEAIQAYHLAIGIDEGYTEAYYNLGNLLRELGRLREAIQVYHNILLIDPDNLVLKLFVCCADI